MTQAREASYQLPNPLRDLLSYSGSNKVLRETVAAIVDIDLLENCLRFLANLSHNTFDIDDKKEIIARRIDSIRLAANPSLDINELSPYHWLRELNLIIWSNDIEKIEKYWKESRPELQDLFCGLKVTIHNITYQISLKTCLNNFTTALKQTYTIASPIQALWDKNGENLMKHILSLKPQSQTEVFNAVCSLERTTKNVAFMMKLAEFSEVFKRRIYNDFINKALMQVNEEKPAEKAPKPVKLPTQFPPPEPQFFRAVKPVGVSRKIAEPRKKRGRPLKTASATTSDIQEPPKIQKTDVYDFLKGLDGADLLPPEIFSLNNQEDEVKNPTFRLP